MQKQTPKTQDEARQYAIDWQKWVAEQSLSYGELAYWQGVFLALGEKFDLLEEYRDNGIL